MTTSELSSNQNVCGHTIHDESCTYCELSVQADEIERLSRELKIQTAVNDLAYRPHRMLVESRDALQKRFDALEAERDRLRVERDMLSRMQKQMAEVAAERGLELDRLRAVIESIAQYDCAESWVRNKCLGCASCEARAELEPAPDRPADEDKV